MRYHVPDKPSALVLLFVIATAILATRSDSAPADEITNFDGLQVDMAVDVTADGGQSFSVVLLGSNTATIGAGSEFTLAVGASGFSTSSLLIDFDDQGLVNAYADSQFAIGNTNFSSFSFDVTFSLLETEITSAISSGDLVRGNVSASGVDPVVWTFVNETDNSFGNIMTFGPLGGTTPLIQLSAAAVPEPSSAILFGLISAVLICSLRKRATPKRESCN